MTTQNMDAGTLVYDTHGAWVGIVSLRNAPGPYLAVQKGRLFPKDIYLPCDAIAHTDADGVHLRLPKDALKDRRYAAPPEWEMNTG